MAKIFNDSKTFVDMKLKRPHNETVQLFREFMNKHDHSPSKEDIIQFVSVSFNNSEGIPTKYTTYDKTNRYDFTHLN